MTYDRTTSLIIAGVLLVLVLAILLISSRDQSEPPLLCAFCDQDKHVHDVLTGQCINRECRCEVGR